jgi:hypothetical protein
MDSHPGLAFPHIQSFVVQLLNAGYTLNKLVDDLAATGVRDELGEDAETEIAAVLIATVATRLSSLPAEDFDRATELMTSTVDAVLADLRRAEEHARRRARQPSARRRPRAARRR